MNSRIYVNESLCKSYRKLFGICNSLYKSKLIKSNFVMNGKLFVESTDGSKKIIGHLADIIKLVGREKVEKVMDEHNRRFNS